MLLTPAVSPDGTSEGFAQIFSTVAQAKSNKTILEQLRARLYFFFRPPSFRLK